MKAVKNGLRARIRKAVDSQLQPTVTVLSSLLAVQDDLGYLPDEAIKEISNLTDSSINDVWGVASFYKNFRFTPPADHTVEVCWGPSCHLLHASSILKRILDYLDISGEGDTEDNKINLRYNTCLGACSQAPVMSVDHHLHGRITGDSACELLDRLLEKGS